ncbi:hypothetical protein OH76DRAFT_1503898 [Lentinus brumalis]|uniref:Uncharacterized protein n=1 Tax=Lentinus brumalis TaxID=2498619 RepID=A0A371DH29_9APHY|nr:hypothetical protein OH76DRAFT_1503898 [Polyporus brumalis]
MRPKDCLSPELGIEPAIIHSNSQEDKTDIVTAVNNSLDILLQHKSRSPVTGFVLVSDSSDTTRRAQMDLVLARAEVPIHSFGYGRSHDPASLGSCRTTQAGLIVDGNRLRIRKISAGALAILSSDGCNVDVKFGELRYGERKEMLVEPGQYRRLAEPDLAAEHTHASRRALDRRLL